MAPKPSRPSKVKRQVRRRVSKKSPEPTTNTQTAEPVPIDDEADAAEAAEATEVIEVSDITVVTHQTRSRKRAKKETGDGSEEQAETEGETAENKTKGAVEEQATRQYLFFAYKELLGVPDCSRKEK